MNDKNKRQLNSLKTHKNASTISEAARSEAEYYKTLGMSQKLSGDDQLATQSLTKALELDSSRADVHFTLAMMAQTKPELNIDIEKINKNIKNKSLLLNAYKTIMEILRGRKQYKEATICLNEICRLTPNNADMLMDLGIHYLLINSREYGIVIMSKALNMAPTNARLKALYSSSMPAHNFLEFYPEVKKAILACFKNMYEVNLLLFATAWISLMLKDPDFESFQKGFYTANDKEFTLWANSLDSKTGQFLSDPYLLRGLALIFVTDRLSEIFFTRMRKYICLSFDEIVKNDRIKLFEKFIFALGEQCFLNEYVFAQSIDEITAIDMLSKKTDKLSIGLTSCYRPLHEIAKGEDKNLHDLASEDKYFSQLVTTQFDNPETENLLKKTIRDFGSFTDQVSQAVREQYEENPYPRWTTLYTAPIPRDDLFRIVNTKNTALDILVAGCGTGRHALSVAVTHPNSRITAIDLSLASLAYAKRKAKEADLLDRIDFVHADILSMKDWPKNFDIIECAGVLHHMDDPFKGWQILTDKLKSGGYMRIGLYSETAREPVVLAREFIAKRDYSATTEGIRECRQAIFDLPADNPIKCITENGDFYTVSLVRDLIFHTHEHRMTLPQIKNMMSRLNLKTIQFSVSDPIIFTLYDEMYPNDAQRNDMDKWHNLEQIHPRIFFGMYQFWCQKN